MWNQNRNNQPPIPFRPGGQQPNRGGFNQHQGGGMMPVPGGFGQAPQGRPGGFGGGGNTGISNFGVMIHGVSQNMQNQYISHICKLEPLIIKEMKDSKFRGSITNMAKYQPPKRELSILIDTFVTVSNQKVDVRL